MKKLLPIYAKELADGRYLISNRLNHFLILDKGSYQEVCEQKCMQNRNHGHEICFSSRGLGEKLEKAMFIVDSTDLSPQVESYRTQNIGLFHNTGLHIFVLTLECNLKCLYCQAAYDGCEPNMMSIDTASKAVDIALSTPEKNISFEFQGGEPLLNFDTLKHIVEYAESKKTGKTVRFSMVDNGQAMTEDKLEFLVKHDVSICFSIDGPDYVHDKNRPSKIGDSNHKNVVFWYHRAKEVYREMGKKPRVSALPTTTRYSLKCAKEIVEFFHDELGEKCISIRPLSPFGRAKLNWDAIQYTADEFLEFYKECMKYIKMYDDGFTETFSNMIMDKLVGKIVNYPDLRSPCGAGTGQLAYNWNGSVYTCDEGRMMSNQGIEVFRAGSVENSYQELISSDAVCNACAASCLENHPVCCRCVYHPICGICPVYNYNQQEDLMGNPPLKDRCKIMQGQMQYLIEWMCSEDEKERSIFYEWTK